MRLLSSWFDRALRGGALLFILGLGWGCTERVEVFDLAAGLPLAEVRGETSLVELGQPRNRWHLQSGWIREGFDKRQRSMYATGGARARLRFRTVRPEDTRVHLQGLLHQASPTATVKLRVVVNGTRVAERRLENRLRWYRFAIPASTLVAGDNSVALQLISTSGADETLSMSWYALDVRRTDPPVVGEPTLSAASRALVLPPGVVLDYDLMMPPRAELILERADPAAADASVAVELSEDGGPTRMMGALEPGKNRVRIDLGRYASKLARLSLRVSMPGEAEERLESLILSSAVVRGAPEAAPKATPPAETGSPPGNVLLYVVDTLRADHLGVYGYGRDVSPNIDHFAQQATVFDSAVAQSSWTRASMASVFTGLWPVQHNTNRRKNALDSEATTLAEVLQQAGYETVAVTQNPNVSSWFGFSQGFDSFREDWRPRGEWALDGARSWFEQRDRSRPFFLWLHTVDPHDPYDAPGGYRKQFDDPGGEELTSTRGPAPRLTQALGEEGRQRVKRHLVSRYDGEIVYADVVFGQVLDLLAQQNVLEETLIVLVSDHGEEFLDHARWGHGKNLFTENLHVPLIIHRPGQSEGQRIPDLVQHVDLFSTIVDFAGGAEPGGSEGRSLLPLIGGAGDAALRPTPVFSYLHLDGRPAVSVVDGDWKLVQRLHNPAAIRSQLFSRAEDPLEQTNLALQRPIRARYLERLIETRLAEGSRLTASEATVDESTEDALRALGYLQ